MLSINAIEYYTEIRNNLLTIKDEMQYVYENNLSEQSQNIISNILKSAKNSSAGKVTYIVERPTGAKGLTEEYNKRYISFKKGFNIVSFSSKLGIINNNINKTFEKFNYKSIDIIELIESLNKLANLYQNIIQNNDDKTEIVQFFTFAPIITSQYLTAIQNMEDFINILSNGEVEEKVENSRKLEIQLLDVNYTVGEFGAILEYLDKAYSSLAGIIPSENIERLRIVKIESGSLLSIVLGNDNIIEVLGYILKKIVDFVYHRFTTEGKLELNSQIMQEISKDAELIKKLEDIGINPTKGINNLEGAFNVATKSLYEIVSKSPRIKVNGEEMQVKDAQKYIEYSHKYLISTTETENNNDKEKKTEPSE